MLDRCPGDGLIGGSCHETFTSVEAVGVQGCTTSRNLCWRDRHEDCQTCGTGEVSVYGWIATFIGTLKIATLLEVDK